MKLLIVLVLLSAAVALVSAAPAPDGDDWEDYYDDYDYDDEDYEEDDSAEQNRLPYSIFDDVRPRAPQRGVILPSTCSWAVVQCCGIPSRMGSRAHCFERLGCSGAWFTDICTRQIKYTVLQSVLNSARRHS